MMRLNDSDIFTWSSSNTRLKVDCEPSWTSSTMARSHWMKERTWVRILGATIITTIIITTVTILSPVDHGVQGALLLEDDPGQVQQNLVPLHLQLGALVHLGVAEPQPAELEVLLKHSAVVVAEVAIIVLVDNLKFLCEQEILQK